MKQKTDNQQLCWPGRNLPGKNIGILLLLIIFATVFQTKSYGQFQNGIKIGVGGATMSDLLEIANNQDLRLSPTIGFTSKYQFTNALALKSGVEYQQKGRKMETENLSISDKLHYLTVPLYAEFSAGEKAGFRNGQRLFFSIGPYLSYLVNADREIDNNYFDLKNNTKSIDAGVGLELGIEYPILKNKALQIALNYNMGLTEVSETERDLHTKMGYISAGILF